MTANQINYWALQETKRSNLAREGETFRSNFAKERETNRSNLAHENVERDKLKETKRHNIVAEVQGTINTAANVGKLFI